MRRVWAIAAALHLLVSTGHAQTVGYDNLKKTVAVEQFLATDTTGGAVTAEGMTAMLTAALEKDGRFVVVERQALASLQAEQTLGQMGSVNAATAAQPGQLMGASAIVRAVITKFEAAASGGGLSVGGFGFAAGLLGGAVGVKGQTGIMEIALRLIDTTTGQVISTSSAQGSASMTSADANLIHSRTGLTAGATTFKNTPMAQAGEQAILKAVDQIAAGMRSVPWTALVVEESKGVIYLNAGAQRNVQVGMPLVAYRKGRTLVDPGTGVVLEVELERIGTLRIVGVREKISTAVLESGEPPLRGNVLKLD